MNESKPTCGWNESKPPTLGLLWEHPPVQSPLDRLFCGGCAQFDREAWEELGATIKGLRVENARLEYQLRNSVTDIAELREELAQARNAASVAH
jgi:hypothetical protein